jgi:predicted nucleic-acid-binding Zn-ribbon protein
MKRTHTCPKCSGRRLVVSERMGFRQKMYKGEEAYVAPLPVVAQQKEVPGVLWGTSKVVEELGTYESWSCVGCGYTELYAQDMERIVTEGAGRLVVGGA